MHPLLNIALRAARTAGDLIVREVDRVNNLPIDIKEKNDFITKIDRHTEYTIINTIKSAYPNHDFLGKETGCTGEGEFLWIIDPLNGTINFLHGLPHFAVSIALKYRGVLDQAVVYDPLKQDLFTASKGKGAQLNNKKIRVSSRRSLDGALLGTGLLHMGNQKMDNFIDCFRSLYPHISGIRQTGVAALDLAYVACGYLDGFWEYNLHPWEISAGSLLIQEAGGINSEFTGGVDYMESGNIISANPKMIKAMLKCLQGHC